MSGETEMDDQDLAVEGTAEKAEDVPLRLFTQ